MVAHIYPGRIDESLYNSQSMMTAAIGVHTYGSMKRGVVDGNSQGEQRVGRRLNPIACDGFKFLHNKQDPGKPKSNATMSHLPLGWRATADHIRRYIKVARDEEGAPSG